MLAAVPVALPAGEAIIALSSLLLWVVVLGFLFAYNATFHWIAVKFADVMDDTHLPGFRGHGPSLGRIGDAVRGVDAAIVRALSKAAKELETLAAKFLNATWATIEGIGKVQLDFAHTVEGAFVRVYRHAIPNAERYAARQAKAAAAPAIREAAWVTDVALPRARARDDVITERVGQLGDLLKGVRAKVRAHEKLLAGAGLAALGLRILSRLKLGWLRCSNVRKAGRRLCAMDLRVLDALLLGTFFIGTTVSLEQTARALLAVEEEFALAVFSGFKELRELK